MNGDCDHGATLLETLVAMMILAMIGTLSFPVLENCIATLAFRRTVDLIERDMLEARAAAISRQSAVFLRISPDGRGIEGPGGQLRSSRAEISFAATPGTFGFFPDGSSTGGTLAILGGGRQVQLAIDPVTGVVVGPR